MNNVFVCALPCSALPKIETSKVICFDPSSDFRGAAKELDELLGSVEYDLAIFGGGEPEAELALRFSVISGADCITEADALEQTETGITAEKRIYGGELTAVYALKPRSVVTLSAGFPSARACPEIYAVLPYREPDWILSSALTEDASVSSLSGAELVFAAGLGAGAAGCEAVKKAAGAFGGEYGVTRPAAMYAWAPFSRQIGVSGVTISPKLCVVFGASGAPAFIDGISKNCVIAAVNTDRNALIFKCADIGIAADAGAVLKELLADLI